MPRIHIEVDGYRCSRCGHEWIPRKPEHPRVCPRCKSPFWDRERRLATFRIDATLRANEGWPPDAKKLQTFERQLGALPRVRKGSRPPSVRRTGNVVRVTFDIQALSEETATSAARAIVDRSARALGLRRPGYRSELRVTSGD